MAVMQPPIRWRDGVPGPSDRTLADEVPVAVVVNGATAAVLLATPADLGDFAIGFALTEGLVATLAEAGEVEVVRHADGIEVRLAVADSAALVARRRTIVGPSGCGLCGVESLAAAAVPPRVVAVTGPRPTPAEIIAAMAALTDAQPLGATTRAVHAAALWRRGEALVVREDVGRHNALDKLVGAAARADIATRDAMLLLTSRVSVEMVQKASRLGCPVVVAVSAPTRLAVATAVAAGLTLVAVARADGFEVFAGGERINWAESPSPGPRASARVSRPLPRGER